MNLKWNPSQDRIPTCRFKSENQIGLPNNLKKYNNENASKIKLQQIIKRLI